MIKSFAMFNMIRTITNIKLKIQYLSRKKRGGIQLWLKIPTQRIICQIILRKTNINGHHTTNYTRDNPIPVEDNGGSDHESSVGDIPRVVHVK
jgi:hypothetical protein